MALSPLNRLAFGKWLLRLPNRARFLNHTCGMPLTHGKTLFGGSLFAAKNAVFTGPCALDSDSELWLWPKTLGQQCGTKHERRKVSLQ